MSKQGLNYYTIDTDRYQDIRIKRLKKDFGCSGLAVYDYILCEIYRVRGCFIVWDENTAFDVAEYFGLKENLVDEIVKYCGAVGLFDKGLLSRGILTSSSIQKRYLEMCKRAKRNDVEIPEEIAIIREETPILPEKKQKTPEEIDKVKKSKVNITPPKSPPLVVAEEECAPKASNNKRPTIEDVAAYMEEYSAKHNMPATFTAQGWIDFYTSNGWRIGKNPMKDWKAAVRTWFTRRNDYADNRTSYQRQPTRYEQQKLEQQQRAAGAAAIIAGMLAQDRPPS